MKTRFNTTQYEFSHGRKPRGRGNWAFAVNGAVIFKNATLAVAKKCIKAEFPKAGKVEVLP